MPQTNHPSTRRDELPLAGRSMELRNFTRAAGESDGASPLATARLILAAGAAVRRYDWLRERYYDEQLVVEDGSVLLGRLERGAPLLNTHSAWDLEDVLGVLRNPEFKGGKLECDATFSRRDTVAGYVQDVQDGIINNVSVGYARKRIEMVPPEEEGGVWVYRVVLWELYEGSLVPIPADMDAQVVRSAGGDAKSSPEAEKIALRTFPCEFIELETRAQSGQPTTPSQKATQMTEAELKAQREQQEAATRAAAETAQRAIDEAVRAASDAAVKRSGEITDMCQRHGLPQMAGEFIRGGKSTADVGLALLDELAKRDLTTGGGRLNVRVEKVGDEHETRMAGFEEAVGSRVDAKVKLTDNGRQYRGMSLLEIGRELLQARGVSTRGMSRMELAGTMLTFRVGMQTTSDFASLFSNVARKRMRSAYEQEPSSYKIWARRAPNAPDFKSMSVVTLSGAPELLKVNEHGEFTVGSLSDGAETYKLLTYGRIVALTRQAIINDDLRSFDRLIAAFGDSAARLENRVVYSELTANALMGDGVALFDASRGNLGTGAGSALQLSSLAAGRAAMRKQKGKSGEQMNVVPYYLIVPAALESLAYQLTSPAFVPTAQTGINEFAVGGRTALTVVVEPLLDGSPTAWYLASASGSIDTVEYAFLDGEEGPVIESQNGFEIDGTSWKCREDFAAKATDFRGLYKSNGA